MGKGMSIAPDSSVLYPALVTHQAIESPQRFKERHLGQFREQGFLAVEDVFSTDEVESAKAGLSFLIGGGVPACQPQFERGVDVTNLSAEEREPYVRKFMYFAQHEPRLGAMANHPVLVKIARMLLNGDEITMIQDMALLKPPHVGREKPWHQDTAYF